MSTKHIQVKSENSREVWILERNSNPLKRIDEAEAGAEKKYIFVGPCAQFSEVNENERLYDKDDYLSHMEYLKEEISENALMGELDHNEDYMVSMKAISHIIRDIYWDEASGNVMIKIELVKTRDGKDAMAIADAGAPIYISSRASGFIDDAGNVELERIYTFDIVYRPGFKNAKLNRLNESLGIKNKSIAVYEMNSKDVDGIKLINNKPSKNNEPMNEFATKEDLKSINENLKNFTDKLSLQMDGFKKTILEGKSEQGLHLKSGKNFGGKNNKPQTILEEAGMPPNTDNSQEDNDAKADEFLAKVAGLEDSLENANTEKEGILTFIEMMTDRVNRQGEYMNMISTFVNKLAKTVEDLAVDTQDNTEYSGVVAEKHNRLMETVEDMTTFIGMVADRTNGIQGYASLIAENQNKLKLTTDANAKSIKEGLGSNSRLQRVLENKAARNGKASIILEGKGSITRKVDNILESIGKKKIDRDAIILEAQYPIVKCLDKETKAVFEKLTPFEKKRVVGKITGKATNESVQDAITKVCSDKELNFLINNMPKAIVPIWETLNSNVQGRIISLSKLKDIRNSDEAEMFWESLDIVGDRKPININEKHGTPNEDLISSINEDNLLGYSDDDIDKSLNN
jgi:hypothetical protein